MHSVVHNDSFTQVHVLHNAQVLDIEPILSLQTVLPVQQASDRVAELVQKPDDGQCVGLGRRSEDVDIVQGPHPAQKYEQVRAQRELDGATG